MDFHRILNGFPLDSEGIWVWFWRDLRWIRKDAHWTLNEFALDSEGICKGFWRDLHRILIGFALDFTSSTTFTYSQRFQRFSLIPILFSKCSSFFPGRPGGWRYNGADPGAYPLAAISPGQPVDDLHDFSMIFNDFLWFSMIFQWFSLLFLWFSMIFQWFSLFFEYFSMISGDIQWFSIMFQLFSRVLAAFAINFHRNLTCFQRF